MADLSRRFERAIANEGTGIFDGPHNSYVQWIDSSDDGLFLEVGDGQPTDYPLPRPFVDMLVPLGWRIPHAEIRNCWFHMPLASGESEASYSARLESVGEMVLEAMKLLTTGAGARRSGG